MYSTSKYLGCVIVLLTLKFLFINNWYESLRNCYKAWPDGHLRPLGHQSPPIQNSVDTLKKFPTPSEFYSNYVNPNRPVIFKDAIVKELAYLHWNDQYLSDNFGKIYLSVEFSKKENRNGRTGILRLAEFLDKYDTDDIYLIDSIPRGMLDDINVPPFLQCGLLKRHLIDVMIWMSSGQTNSVVHYDTYDNVHCVVEGTKYLYLTSQLSYDEFDHPEEAFSGVDVERVDLFKYPGFSNLPWYNITLTKGDCIFIPYKWIHQVKSSVGRNLSFNIWLTHLYWFNLSECSRHNPMATHFSQDKFATHEDESRNTFIKLLGGPEVLNMQDFTKFYRYYISKDVEEGKQLFKEIDENKDGEVSISEMYNLPSHTLLHYVGYLDNVMTECQRTVN